MSFSTIQISAGEYTIGDHAFPLSRPVHRVTVKAFALMQCAVSNQQFAKFVSAGGYREDTFWTEMGIRWRNSKDVEDASFLERFGF